jgi:hypothetical protein
MSRTRNVRKQRNRDSSTAYIPKGMLYVIGGVDCHFWFDDDGDLCVAGPEEGRATGQALLDRYGPLMKTKKVADCVSGLEPVGRKWLSIKKCAVLSLMLEAEARGDRAEDVVLAKALIESRITEIRELPGRSGCPET